MITNRSFMHRQDVVQIRYRRLRPATAGGGPNAENGDLHDLMITEPEKVTRALVQVAGG
jgi:hypothetical protein